MLAGVLCGSRALRLAGATSGACVAALFAAVGRRAVVPGANDNASGVAALLGIAADAADPRGVRVVLLSSGSEETMLEGMDAFLRRHALDPASTLVVCLDMLGWDRLVVRASEGVLRRYASRPADVELVLRAARAAEVEIAVAPPHAAPSDGLAARWAGLPTVFLSSRAAGGGSPHYHRPSDAPENVVVDTVVAARRVCVQLVAELATERAPLPGFEPGFPP